MIVVYRQSQNLQDAMYFFDTNSPTELPFVDSTLGNVSVSGWRAFSDTIKFYIPKNWTHLDDGSGSFVVYDNILDITLDGETTVFTDVNILPLSLPSENGLYPQELFKNGDLAIGFGFKTMKDFLTCKKSTRSEEILFIEYSLDTMTDTILASAGSSKEYIGSSIVYSGGAHIDEESEILGNSVIYGPCIIVNSVLNNTTVYPGSVIINSRVSDSKIENSYLQNSGVTNSHISHTTAYSAFLDNINAVGSRFPKLTQMNGKK